MSPEEEAVASKQRQQVRDVITGGVVVAGLCGVVMIGLNRANQIRRKNDLAKGQRSPFQQGNGGGENEIPWQYQPPPEEGAP
jgi:hypothetical protein